MKRKRNYTVALRELEQAEIRENGDGTFDLVGVELLSTGGPIFGVGSPPDGDFWTLDELRSMVTADSELGDELDPPNKIGHPDEQILVRNSIEIGDLPEPEDGELPAVGWLEDLRLEGEKLLCDIRKVPKIVLECIQKGAYRKRSVELSKVTSQKTGKTYDWVVTGLAWLGGKMPAVKTLGDVVALYEGDVPVRRRFVAEIPNLAYAAGDVVWDPKRSLQSLRYQLQEALAGPSGSEGEPRWYVIDVSIDGQAIVEDWSAVSPGELDTWLLGFTIEDDGVHVDPFDRWVKVERTFVEAARQNAERLLTLSVERADTRPMKFTAEQRRAFAEATGLEEAKVTDKMLEDAGVTPGSDDQPDPTTTDPTTTDERDDDEAADNDDDSAADDEATKQLEERMRRLEARNAALETESKINARREFVDGAIKDHKIHPGQRAKLETLFDKDPEGARAFVADLPEREDLRELGASGETDDERDLEEEKRDYQGGFENRFGKTPAGVELV